MIVSRFAPAPTGLLHLGHVVNAIYVWGLARAAHGQVLLRIEDHDRQRSRPQFESAILDDLAWLGFEADAGMVRQSERGRIYRTALDRLKASGLVYGCECTRREIEQAASGARGGAPSDPRTSESELRYPGTCRSKSLAGRPGRGVRIRLTPSIERFDDLRHGWQEQCPAEQCGDLLARDRDGNWTYQFAVTVDDLDQGVTLVVRGDDLLASTGRQLQLARLLGRERPPLFLHHRLVMKTATQKLSKADGDTSIRDLRAAGQTPPQVIATAARLAGLTSAQEVAAVDVASIVGPRYLPVLMDQR